MSTFDSYSQGDLVIIRTSPDTGFGEAYAALDTARALANSRGHNPKMIVLPRGVQVEHHREGFARWAAENGLGIRCSMEDGNPVYTVGSSKMGILSESDNLLDALEKAYEANNERS